MNTWTLASRNGFYTISSDGIRENVSEGNPLLIDPSITFRKHFELPKSVDKDPRTLRLELFSRFLPADIDNYICQFEKGPLTQSNSSRVLGLAIKTQDMDWLEGIHGENENKFILERQLKPPEFSDCVLELDLPEGKFFGVFSDDFLNWTRYLKDPDDEQINETLDYIQNEYPDSDKVIESPDFQDEESSWIEFINEWLPGKPNPAEAVIREQETDFWSRWQATAWTLLILVFMTIGVWWYYNHLKISNNREWARKKSRQFFDTSKNPFQTVKNEITELKNTIDSRKKSPEVYPRLSLLDEVLKNVDIHLLQLKIRKNQGQIVFMTNSLKEAEDLKGALLSQPQIAQSEIVSTSPQTGNDFQFKVNLNVLWNTMNQDETS